MATRQHGVLSRGQLLELGLSRRGISWRIARGYLDQIHEGVYRVGHDALRQQGLWMAAVLASGPRAALSHRSAGAAWGIAAHGREIEVTRPRGGNFRPHGFRLHQSRMLESRSYDVSNGIPITSVVRTLMDLAATLGTRPLLQAIWIADRQASLDWRELESAVDAACGVRGMGRLRAAMHDYDPRESLSESGLEDRFLDVCRRFGVPAPESQVRVEGFDVDFYWGGAGLIVETDGYASHANRAQFNRDRERDRKLRLAGYAVARYTWHDVVERPGQVADEVRALLRSGSSSERNPRAA